MRVFVQVSEAGQLLLYVTHICTGLQQTHTFINIHVFSGSSTQGTLFNEESVSVELWLAYSSENHTVFRVQQDQRNI